MNWQLASKIVQIVISILLVLFVLIQAKGTGLSSAISGSIGYYRSRRGIERVIFIMTCILGALLIANSLFMIVVS